MVWRLAQLGYLMMPAYIGNMAPPFVRFWHGWNRPINAHRLGSHKTVLGALAGVVAAVVTAFVQSRICWSGSLVACSDWLAIGVLLGTGAIVGDAMKSYVKRRRGIAPGARWIPADQLDFVAGALILIWPLARLRWQDVVLVLAVTFVADIIVNQISFRLGVRDTAW